MLFDDEWRWSNNTGDLDTFGREAELLGWFAEINRKY